MKNLMDLRGQYKDVFFKKHGVKLGLMSAFVRACTLALQEIKEVNARIESSDMVYSDFVDISVAVATPKGLVTPVLRNCEKLSFAEIEKQLSELAQWRAQLWRELMDLSSMIQSRDCAD